MSTDHDALLRDWRANAAKQDDANCRFLRSLKMLSDPDRIDDLARELHEEVFSRIDGTRCANCCKTMKPGLTAEDVDRIANHLGMTREAFTATYLERDVAEPGYQMNAAPCPFLGADDRCTIYAVRPAACREFPHTDKDGFIWRTYSHSSNTQTCPAVYHIVRGMRKRLRR